jgi:hypothetical protein
VGLGEYSAITTVLTDDFPIAMAAPVSGTIKYN